jgi:hypothetical protein
MPRFSPSPLLATYVGLGASAVQVSSGGGDRSLWLARALFGVRVTLVERVALFGEVGLEYRDTDTPSSQRAELVTFPIGVVVFLK